MKEDAAVEDAFQQQLMHLEPNFDGAPFFCFILLLTFLFFIGTYPPIRVDKKTLANIPPEEIFVRHYPSTLMPYRYYR